MNNVDNASEPLTTLMSRTIATMMTLAKMTMERREEVRQQEEAWKWDKQRQQCIKTTNYDDVKTNNGAAGGGAVMGEGRACDKQQQR
jgi:hypothetical protein